MNLVTGFDTDSELEKLFYALRDVENRNVWQCTEPRFAQRRPDIDIPVRGDMICDEDSIDWPRMEIVRQADVLLPPAALAPNARHPVPGDCYADMFTRLNLDASGMHPDKLSLGPGQ